MINTFRRKPRQLSRPRFIEMMLDLQQTTAADLLKASREDFKPETDEKLVRLECEILSLWILSLVIVAIVGDESGNDLRDDIHNEYCLSKGYTRDATIQFFAYLGKRYGEYFEGYNIWTKDHVSGDLLGLRLLGALRGQASGSKLPLDNPVLASHASSLVIDRFMSNLQLVSDLKKKFDMSEIGSAFAKDSSPANCQQRS